MTREYLAEESLLESPDQSKVTYFRSRKIGPEAQVEAAVARNLASLFPNNERQSWVAGSLPVGAGVPDLLFVKFEPAIVALAAIQLSDAQILAYLRAVGRAKVDTIGKRLGLPCELVEGSLESLLEADVITEDSRVFSLSPTWRTIMPEVVAIEAKIANWRQALRQAARNRIFSHQSFVALPQRVADRVHSDPSFTNLGVGILAVSDDGQVCETLPAVSANPRVWTYYYRIAMLAARHVSCFDV